MKHINFYRPYLIEKRKAANQVLAIVSVFGVMVLSIFASNAFMEIKQKSWSASQAQKVQERDALKALVQTLEARPRPKESDQERAEVDALEKKVQLFTRLSGQAGAVSKVYFDIEKLRILEPVPGVWLTQVDWSVRQSKIHVKGVALDSQGAARALELVSQIPWNVSLDDASVGFEKDSSKERLHFEWIAGEQK